MFGSRREFLQTSLAAGAFSLLALRADWLQKLAAADRAAAGRNPLDLAKDEDFWFHIQQSFTVDRSMINLNNGGVSPSPRIVQDAMRRHLEFANESPARNLWTVLNPQVETVRERLAASFGCEREEMAITRNSSEALEICIYGMDLKPGDEVLTTEQDYPRMLTTYEQRQRREGIKLVKVPVPTPAKDLSELVDIFARAITPKTRVILCSHVVFLTGQIFPVRDICRLGRERGIPVIVDGAHAYAHVAFKRDDLECDYYGNSLHKWMTAPHGTGFLYVRKDRIESLWPLMAAPEPMTKDIRKFEEIGTHPAANKLAIAEAINFHEAIGPQRKEARLRYLRDYWAMRIGADKRARFLTNLDPRHSCALTTFSIDGIDNAKLVDFLWNKHHIVVVAIDHPVVKGIRVTPNVYTTLDELDIFCRALEEVLTHGLPT